MENTDRELLEMAAKAAEIKSTGWINKSHEWFQCDGVGFNDEYDCQQLWNPLTDDGDALRLAVKLGMTVLIHRDMALAESGARAFQAREKATPDYSIETATRRAIVRAAAEIGKGVK